MTFRREILAEGVEVYLGDCLEVLPTLGKFDACVTDPPYGVLDEEWDDMDEQELSRFTMSWLAQVRAHSDTGVFFFGERTRQTISPLLHSIFPVVRQVIWNKGGGNIADDGLFYSYESAYFCHPVRTWSVVEPKTLAVASLIRQGRERAGLSRGGVDMVIRGKKTGLCYRWEEACCLPTEEQSVPLKALLNLGEDFDSAIAEARYSRDNVVALAQAQTAKNAAKFTDVLSFPVPTRKQHPTEKPVPLMRCLVEVAAESGATVLDPFMGSGTTGVAAVGTGRSFTGIEREPKFFDIACKRIEASLRQADLFISQPTAQQLSILDGDAA
jgi:DNA modification methylase